MHAYVHVHVLHELVIFSHAVHSFSNLAGQKRKCGSSPGLLYVDVHVVYCCVLHICVAVICIYRMSLFKPNNMTSIIYAIVLSQTHKVQFRADGYSAAVTVFFHSLILPSNPQETKILRSLQNQRSRCKINMYNYNTL